MRALSPRFVQTKLMSLDDMYDVVGSVVDSLPEGINRLAVEIDIAIDNFPPESILADLGITNKYDLLGLYKGVPLKSSVASGPTSNSIFLYRCPLLRYAEEHQEPIDQLIQHVFLYEMGHHLGIDSHKFWQSLNKKC